MKYEDLKQSFEGNVRDIQAQERYTLSKETPETSATKNERALCQGLQKHLQHGRVKAGTVLPANFVFKGNSKRDHPYRNSKNWNQGRSNGNGHKNRQDKNNGGGRHQNGSGRPSLTTQANVELDPTCTIDSGCTHHMTHESHWFAHIATSGGSITVRGKNQIPIEGIGRVELVVIDSNGNPKTLTLHGVLYEPQLHFNLLSVPAAVKHDYRFNFDRKQCAMQTDQRFKQKAPMANNSDLYRFYAKPMVNSTALEATYYDIQRLQADNAKEFDKLGRISFKKYGTHAQFTNAFTPQQNGVAERRMPTIMERVRVLLLDGKLPKRQWAECHDTDKYDTEFQNGWTYPV
ncbi:unnamed protein product [Phytophthora fragariaefolia]|uniref:Unnamed protein product n=1 Tax=Phytophthora fragariaefolia TaxID=1490495 RepID=A0A9W6XHC6_9STRA|nr:unnamed protein product [Phytophthora fragariaefolia]